MDGQRIAKSTFIINVVALVLTMILGYLLVFKGLQLTSKPVKMLLFFTLVTSTILGLYLSATKKVKSLILYYFFVLLIPLVLTAGSVIAVGGIAPLHVGGQIISSTFGGTEKLIEKDNFYIKRSFSLMSTQWYDLCENRGAFEKKLGHFNAGEEFDFTDFSIVDSIGKKYIKLFSRDQTTQIEEFVN